MRKREERSFLALASQGNEDIEQMKKERHIKNHPSYCYQANFPSLKQGMCGKIKNLFADFIPEQGRTSTVGRKTSVHSH